MTQGERVRLIRKEKELTLEKFGDKIGIKKNSLSQIENGVNNLTEQMAKSICREFNVNEEWLRTGEGEMFNELSEAEETAAFLGRIMRKDMDHDVRRKLIHALSRMTDEQLLVMTDMVKNLIDEFKDEKKD